MVNVLSEMDSLLGLGYRGEVLLHQFSCKLISLGPVDWHTSKIDSSGILQVTNYALIFETADASDKSFRLPIGMIASIHIPNQDFIVSIHFKDFWVVVFELFSEQDRDLLFQKTYFITFCLDLQNCFPFHYKSAIVAESQVDDGWAVYDPIAEYVRLGIDCDKSDWRTTDINRNHKICDTYQQLLAVPSSVTDEDIQASAAFR